MKNFFQKRFISVAVFIVIIAIFITFQATYLFVNNAWKQKVSDMISTNKNLISESISVLDSQVSSNTVSTFETQDIVSGAMSGYIEGTNDRFAMYLDENHYSDYITYSSQPQSSGIGISALYDSTHSGIYVVSVLPDSPAKQAGIAPGNIITHINDTAVSKLGFYSAMLSLCGGNMNSSVTLRVTKHDRASESVTVSKDTIKGASITTKKVSRDIGLIAIPEFSSSSFEDFSACLEDILRSGADKLIIDLRNNPGGDIDTAAKILDFLLPEGTIVSIADKTGAVRTIKSDINSFAMPMCVLVNDNTVCEAEVFALSMKELGGCAIIGEKTYGKGLCQKVIPLTVGGGACISTTNYLVSGSKGFDKSGISPDHEVLFTPAIKQLFFSLTDDSDLQLQKAIDILDEMDANITV